MARIKGAKKTNRYPDEFEIKAVLLANQQDILANPVRSFANLLTVLLGSIRN